MRDPTNGSLSVRRWGAVLLLLLVFFAQLALSSRQLSLTSDEPPNLGVGYTYLTTGETWYIPSLGHPPLLFAWMAIPVALSNPHIPVETLTNWGTFPLPPYLHALFPLLGPVEQLEVIGRVPMMLLGLLLGSLIFRWAADLFGYKGGLVALALMVFDPTIVAHTPLATGDLGITLVGFAMLFVGWRWVRTKRHRFALEETGADADVRPKKLVSAVRWGVVIGLLGGATMAAKVSGFIWVGLLVGLLVIVEWLGHRDAGRRTGAETKDGQVQDLPLRWWVVAGMSVIIVAVALLFLWAMYGFRVGPVDIGSYTLTLPASDHWAGLVRQMERSETRMMFLAGEAGVGGWWWYFPLAFLIKNPVPLLVIWIGAILVSLCTRSLTLADLLFLLAFPLVYSVAGIYSGINIGYRHMLPIHPFLHVLGAQWVTIWAAGARAGGMRAGCPRSDHSGSTRLGGRGNRAPTANRGAGKWMHAAGRVLWVVLWVWYVAGTVRIFPHYLAYFNELAGGPSNGYRYLVDSNLDWGQSFKTLRKELEQLDIRLPLRLGHYWYAGPELYGVQYEPLPPLSDAPPVFSPRFDPPPGTYVLGATLLYSGPGDLEQYEWFKHHTPVAQPGHALFVYRVDPHDPPTTWIAQCTVPAVPLNEETITREFYTQPLRRIVFDCTQSWIYPEGGETGGWYALHDEVLQEEIGADADVRKNLASAGPMAQHLDQAHLAYVHSRYDGLGPAFHLYEYRHSDDARSDDVHAGRGDAVTTPYTSTAWIASPDMSADRFNPDQITSAVPVEAPVALDGPLTYLGHRVVESGPQAVTVETWWRVREGEIPRTRPLSIMAHLVRGDGQPVGVADGLGVPLDVWQAGDILVQYHEFALPPDLEEGTYWLQTGVYWLDTLERQQVVGPMQKTGDSLIVGEILSR
jgi:hypothetical protein